MRLVNNGVRVDWTYFGFDGATWFEVYRCVKPGDEDFPIECSELPTQGPWEVGWWLRMATNLSETFYVDQSPPSQLLRKFDYAVFGCNEAGCTRGP